MVTIGICAKNECGMIVRMLDSVVVAALRIDSPWEIVICINGSTDGTLNAVNCWVGRNPGIKCSTIFQKEGNLVEAQRKIIGKKEQKDSLTVFVDADVLVDPQCFVFLIDAMQNPNIAVAYAISKPLEHPGVKKTLIERTLDLYDSDRTIFTQRRHLHGRTFIIKEWSIPRTDPALIIDDIFLSLEIQNQKGADAILRVPKSIIYAQQICFWCDYYKVFRRRAIELTKIFALFPEYKKLPPEYINRRVQFSLIFQSSLKDFVLWMIFFTLRIRAKMQLRMELFLNPIIREQWEQPLSTKKLRSAPFLVLIEGVDCSGKKTVGREVLQALCERGLRAELHNGPLSSLWYEYLSHFVSLHSCPNIIRSLIYVMDGIGDRKGVLRFDADVILQISSPFRVLAYSETVKSRIRVFISSVIIKRYLAQYNQVWYLTAPYATRIERHKNQVAAGENPDLSSQRFWDEKFFQKYDSILKKRLLSTIGISQTFDTSSQSREEIVGTIVNSIINKL